MTVSSKSTSKSSAVLAPTASGESLVVPTITAADVATLVGAIDTFAQLLGAGFTVPQPEEMKRLAKPRKAAASIVTQVADLSTRYGVASAAYPTSVTLAQQQFVNTMAPVAERLAAIQKLVGSVLFVGQSAAWSGSMVTYGLLKNEARGNAVLRNALLTVRDQLRPTYETEDGGTTKVRSRSKGAVAKEQAAHAAPPATAAPPAPGAPAVTEAAAKS